MEKILSSSFVMNPNSSDHGLPISHSALNSGTTMLNNSSKPHHSRPIKYTRRVSHSRNESQEDINYEVKCMEMCIDGNPEEVIEDGEVNEVDGRFHYHNQTSINDFNPHRIITNINVDNHVTAELSSTASVSKVEATAFSVNTPNFTWNDSNIEHQFKTSISNIKQETNNSLTEATITSPSHTFTSNSPPNIFSSSNFKSSRCTNTKYNPSWLATQPKLNAKSKSGYILFSAEVRKRVMNENPEAGFGEVSKIVGIEWKRLSDEDKREYETRAQYIAAERAKAELLTPNSKLPQPGQIRIYCCRWQQCDFQFDSQDGLYEHIRTSHTSKLDTDNQYVCLWNSCLKYRKEGKPFPSLPRLNRHLKEKHLASAMRLVFPNQRSKNFFVYTPLKQDSLSLPSTSNGASHHHSKGGQNNIEHNGHFVHYPYGDMPSNPVACEIATPISSSYGTENRINFGIVKKRTQGGQHSVNASGIHNMTTTSSIVTPKSGGGSALLNGALPSHSSSRNSGTHVSGSYNYTIQQQSQQRNQSSNQQQHISQQTVYIPPGQQAIIVNGVTVYIPNNAQTIILPPGYTGPQQQHQIVVHTQSSQQQFTQQVVSSSSSIQTHSIVTSPSIQQKYQHNAFHHSTVTSHSSQLFSQPNAPTFQQQHYNQCLPSSTISSIIHSQSLSSASAMQNVSTNVVQHYQTQQQASGHYTLYDQSPISSTLNQHQLACSPSTTMHSLAITSELQHADAGRVVISATPKYQIQSEPTFVSPSTSVHVRRVVHSEAYIRYLESMYNSGGGKQQRNTSKWDKTLLASARNTVVPEHKRLPYDWIRHSSNGSKHKEDEVIRALWKLREHLIEDTTGIIRSNGTPYEAEAPQPHVYNLLTTMNMNKRS